MIILAIETSCDDTCISLIEIPNPKSQIPKFKILSNIVSSQVKLHAKYGGVYPFLAKREHQRNLVPVLKKALIKASLLNSKFQIPNSNFQFKIQNALKKIDLIAVTVGPGLEPCLWTGVNFAKALGYFWNLPIIPINHIEAHIFANFAGSNSKLKCLLPAICLVVSGGHTQLILMKDFGRYKILGETRDDAAGEYLDKTARILGLGYPGGPAIAKLASQWESKIQPRPGAVAKFKIVLPRPMIFQKNYDFSFSGLKTAVLYHYQNQPERIRKSKEYIQAMAFEIQQAMIDVLIRKTIRAAKDYKISSIILSGGVAANQELKKQFKIALKKEIPNSLFLIPNSKLCTDNAVMVAITAYYHWLSKKIGKIKVNPNLKLVS